MPDNKNIELNYAMISHQGVERETNDDKVFASPEIGLWILSDGVGGLAQGEQASQFVVDEISKSIGLGRTLQVAVHSAHSVIKAFNRHETEDRGATVVTLLNNKNHYQIAWVGDSRAYLWNKEDQTLQQLTEDHTLVQKLINAGLLDPNEAKDHPQRHVITQCLGVEDKHQLNIGLLEREWQFGESIIIVSDGVYEEISTQEFVHCLNQTYDQQSKVEQLIKTACENGGKDNLSIILIESPVKEKTKNKKASALSFLTEFLSKFKKG